MSVYQDACARHQQARHMTPIKAPDIASQVHILVTHSQALAGDAMQIPDAFYDYCIWLHQDSEYDYGPTLENMIAGAFSRIRPDQHKPLRAFIGELLTGAYSEADLMRILHSTDADVLPVGPGAAKYFLTCLRDVIDGKYGSISDR
jgi:hypothetical protein